MVNVWAFLGSRLWESLLSAGSRVSSGKVLNSWPLIVLSLLANSKKPLTSACLNAYMLCFTSPT